MSRNDFIEIIMHGVNTKEEYHSALEFLNDKIVLLEYKKESLQDNVLTA